MAVDPELLAMLVCPACRARLEPPTADVIACSGCGRTFPIRDGIPVMLVDEASPPTRRAGPE